MADLRDRDLVRLHWPKELRPAFDALLSLDDAMGDVVAQMTQPALAAIKLAWWREQLQALDHLPPPAEPRLRAAAAQLLPKGISGAQLAQLEDGWAALLDENAGADATLERGATLFALAGQLLGGDGSVLPAAGRLYAAGSLRRRGLAPAGALVPADLPRVPRRLRPLTALSALARRDLDRRESEATPGRAWTLLRHRLTGRM